MTFISYAQNMEDVMLHRALREVAQGFYIDVGAQDPVIDSVTRAFYERGWRGINIEPVEEYFHKLEHDRPADINLMIALGREAGETVFHEVMHTGLSTTNADYARRHAEAGYEVCLRTVSCKTLDVICTEHRVEIVHFLKIDVEGAERAVLGGFSFERVRPWIVVMEATEPNSTHDVSAEWEHLLVNRGYKFVYFDGVNRFYLANEHDELEERFSSPPNFFDSYIRYDLLRTREELEKLLSQGHESERRELVAQLERLSAKLVALRARRESERLELVAQMEGLRRKLTETEIQLVQVENRLRSTRASFSWKLTSPFREVRRGIVRLVRTVRRLFHIASYRSSQVPAGQDFIAAAQPVAGDAIESLTEPGRSLYRALRDLRDRRQE